MADTSTIASLAIAGGTLVLAVATFSPTHSANRFPYGDHEGGQRTITRLFPHARTHASDDEQPWLWACSTSRH